VDSPGGGGVSGFFQMLTNSIFSGEGTSDEFSFYKLETKI